MAGQPLDAQVAVVGAGPVGLTLAARLAHGGVGTLLLEQQSHHSGEGSRALCMQRETLEIWARLGIGEQVARRGVQWAVGRTYFRDRELFSIRLPSDESDHFPPFVNISQTEVEQLLLARLAELPMATVRWGHRVGSIVQDPDGVTIQSDTAEGVRTHRVAYLVGTDGAHSTVRHLLGMDFPGHSHDDLFLICDVRTTLPFPNERRFFFDPSWNPGRQVLVHPQPDGVWRIDWQVPDGTDVDVERSSGELDRRIRTVVGSAQYELEWVTAYRFHQRLAERFRVGRAFLAGDAAHLMSPFGARGLNSGAADAENLAWKLSAVLEGQAPDALLDSYQHERRPAALENLGVTDASMRFMVPHGRLRRAVRNLVLRGSTRVPALRRRVNSGRLAQPFVYRRSPLVAPGHGGVAPDARCRVAGRPSVTRLRDLVGESFLVLLACPRHPERAAQAAVRAAGLAWPADCRVAVVGARAPLRDVAVLEDAGELEARYAADGPRAWLIRPDGHVAASVALGHKESVDGLPDLMAVAIGGGREAVSRSVADSTKPGQTVDNSATSLRSGG